MAIYLSEKLKQLRTAKDLTQEQVADFFNVSPQTVSRWETGVNYPDIELLPVLANFFEVSIDDMLGVDISKREERIITILDEQNTAMNNSNVDLQIEILRKGLHEFPNHYALSYRLAGALWGMAFELRKNGNNSEIKGYAQEAIELFERVISMYEHDGNRFTSMPILEQKYGYTYATVHYGAIHGTARAYKYFFDDTKKALEWANRLPNINNSQAFVLSHVLDGEEKLKQVKKNIGEYCSYLTDQIEMLLQDYDNDVNIPEEIVHFQNVVTSIGKFISPI